MTSRTLVLFDIDGTLLSTAGAGRRAITRALGEEFGGLSFEGVRFDGKTDPQIVCELFDAAGRVPPHDDALISAVCERYVALLETELRADMGGTRVLPGVVELLDALADRDDVVMGLLTGNLAPGARLKLRAAGLAPERFPVGAFGSDSAVRRELPAIAARRAAPHMGGEPVGASIVIVGDTPADIDCGRPVGARVIAVATGGYDAGELASHAPYAVFEDLQDTDAVLTSIVA